MLCAVKAGGAMGILHPEREVMVDSLHLESEVMVDIDSLHLESEVMVDIAYIVYTKKVMR